jgi:hypothetical protein
VTSSPGQDPPTEPFSKVVAPALVGFTLPTVAVVATTKDLAWGEPALICFLLSSGLLLAAFQLSIGRFESKPPQSGLSFDVADLRFVLSSIGMLTMAAGLGLIVLPPEGFAHGSWRLLAVAVLLAGAAIPIGLRMVLWALHRGEVDTMHRGRRRPPGRHSAGS